MDEYREHILEMKNGYNALVRKPDGKRHFGRSRWWCEDNIKIHPKEIEWKVVDWIIRKFIDQLSDHQPLNKNSTRRI